MLTIEPTCAVLGATVAGTGLCAAAQRESVARPKLSSIIRALYIQLRRKPHKISLQRTGQRIWSPSPSAAPDRCDEATTPSGCRLDLRPAALVVVDPAALRSSP